MKILLLLATCMVVAEGSTTPPPVTEHSHPGPQSSHSLLFTLLQAAGYSDTCVAGALDYCSSAQQEDGRLASLVEEARVMVQQVSLVMNKWRPPPRHCKDLLDLGDSGRGLRQVYPYPGRPHHLVTLYCDHTVDGGGWTVFQRRSNDTVRQNFIRTWADYASGFGNLEGEFWLGLDLLHELTSTTEQQLRVDLYDYEGGHRWAKYGTFHVGAPETNYCLSVGRYSGDAGDSMAYHNGSEFTTHDADHDKWPSITVNCAEGLRGGWWYSACFHANLNGYQHEGVYTGIYNGIVWKYWRGYEYSLRRTTMMIRPAF